MTWLYGHEKLKVKSNKDYHSKTLRVLYFSVNSDSVIQ